MLTDQLFDFLAASPSCYHAVQALAKRLEQNGYTQLREQDAWTLTPGGKYFVTRNGSSLLSFRIPQSAPAGFLMAAAHTDSPTFKIKHNPEKKSGPYVQLSTENGYRGAQALMTRDTGVTAIMCANDLTAIGAVRTLHENGVRIPQDISIIGIDDIDMVQYLPTKLTSVHIPVDEMGQMATKLLIDRIDGGHDLPLQVSLPFYIAERESCAKPPKTPWRPR